MIKYNGYMTVCNGELKPQLFHQDKHLLWNLSINACDIEDHVEIVPVSITVERIA